MTWYDDVMRTIIELTDEQLAALKRLCDREKISRAEAVRRAVDKLLTEQNDTKGRRETILNAAFGSWKEDRRDAREIVDEMRAEWDKD
jgi:metal-responsive CopG/Arc/MetJ family transcriptional regulator